MKHIRQMLALLMCLLLLPVSAMAAENLPLQDAHRTRMTQQVKELSNGAEVHLWQIETACQSVSDQLNALAKGYADTVAPTMKRPGYNGSSWLYVSIRHSRTGLTWMSFMVQSRYIFDKATQDVRFTTRTYDMKSGARIMLTDIFPSDSEAWALMEQAVRDRINAYYPELTAEAAALEAVCSRKAIEEMDFTLHGMSLVLHLHAADFYPGREQLIEVPLYYPQIRPMMTEKARQETDNLRYYRTIALTYDDGPNGWVTREMLNALLKTGERATFFIVGDRVSRFAYLVQREHDEGHAIATHNFQHVYANQVDQKQRKQLRAKVDLVHNEVIGITPDYARAPGGIWKPMAKAELGWPLIQWTAEARDWEGDGGRDPFKVADQITGMAKDGGILLMHDMQKNSIAASEMFIPRLQERGFIFLTIDELFAKDGVELQPDTAYWRCSDGVTTDE